MGSLIGHIVPGTAFAVVAVWWTFELFLGYYDSLLNDSGLVLHERSRPRNRRLQNAKENNNRDDDRGNKKAAKTPSPCVYPPLESAIRLVFITLGMSGEYFTALDEHGNFVTIHNAQHMTMFGFFLLPTIFELMYFYGVPGLPPLLDLVTGALAFAVEAFIFVWHLHGRDSLDVQVHKFIVYAIVMCVISTILEIFFPDDVRPVILRAFFTLLQGTWFYFVGFILYPPSGWTPWKRDDHHQMMMVTMMFAWNAAFIVAFQMLAAFVAYSYSVRKVRNRRCSRLWRRNDGNDAVEDGDEEMMTQNLLYETT